MTVGAMALTPQASPENAQEHEKIIQLLREFKTERILQRDERGGIPVVLLGTSIVQESPEKSDEAEKNQLQVRKPALVFLNNATNPEQFQMGHDADASDTIAKNTIQLNEHMLSVLSHNDRFATVSAQVVRGAFYRIQIICPATEKDIAKATPPQFVYCMRETPQAYEQVVKPYIEELVAKNDASWVQNILDGTREADRVMYQQAGDTNGFMLLPTDTYDAKAGKAVKFLAIARINIHTLRELRAEHIPLLEDIYAKSTAAIHAQTGVPASQMRAYVHYLPSFYHLHVHFMCAHITPTAEVESGRAHLLLDVIDHLRLSSTYYADATLSVMLRSNHPLASKYAAIGILES